MYHEAVMKRSFHIRTLEVEVHHCPYTVETFLPFGRQ